MSTRNMLQEFKNFVARGNVLDLAIGIILGAGFGKVVSSFVGDVLMPPLGLLLGKVDFSNLYINLSGRNFASLAEARAVGAPTINYGLFLNHVVDFVIVAFAVFMVVQAVNRLRKNENPPTVETTSACPFCLLQIPLDAKKCAHCTSTLRESTEEQFLRENQKIA